VVPGDAVGEQASRIGNESGRGDRVVCEGDGEVKVSRIILNSGKMGFGGLIFVRLLLA
jgi:hypothetical protein